MQGQRLLTPLPQQMRGIPLLRMVCSATIDVTESCIRSEVIIIRGGSKIRFWLISVDYSLQFWQRSIHKWRRNRHRPKNNNNKLNCSGVLFSWPRPASNSNVLLLYSLKDSISLHKLPFVHEHVLYTHRVVHLLNFCSLSAVYVMPKTKTLKNE